MAQKSLMIRYSSVSPSLLIRFASEPNSMNLRFFLIKMGVASSLVRSYKGLTSDLLGRSEDAKPLFLLYEEILVDVIVVVDPCFLYYVFHL